MAPLVCNQFPSHCQPFPNLLASDSLFSHLMTPLNDLIALLLLHSNKCLVSHTQVGIDFAVFSVRCSVLSVCFKVIWNYSKQNVLPLIKTPCVTGITRTKSPGSNCSHPRTVFSPRWHCDINECKMRGTIGMSVNGEPLSFPLGVDSLAEQGFVSLCSHANWLKRCVQHKLLEP